MRSKEQSSQIITHHKVAAIYADTGSVGKIYGDTVFRGNGAIFDGGAIKMTNLATLETEYVVVEYNWSSH